MFDWDGTLVDSLPLKIRNVGILFEQAFGLPAASVERSYQTHSGIPRRDLFDAILADHQLAPLADGQFTDLSRRFSELNQAALTDPEVDSLVSTDTRDTLTALQEIGFPMYVSSSAESGEIHIVARALGLDGFFLDILGSRPGFSKGREHIEYVLELHKALPSQVAFIGDDPADIRLGREAGVITIARLKGAEDERVLAEEPHYGIRSLNELIFIFKQEE